MLTPLNTRQRAWLQKATKPEVAAFLVKGEVEIQMMFSLSENREYFRPAIRGVLLEKEFNSQEEAAEHGQKYLDALKIRTDLPSIDEAILGIDGGNTVISDRLEQATIRAEQILHLGSMLTAGDAFPDAIDEFLDNFDERDIERLQDDLPFLQKLFDLINNGLRYGEIKEEFAERCWRSACFGFLVRFATPVMKPHIDDGQVTGHSYSWGYYSTCWFYGETFEEATQKALAWADSMRAEENEKAGVAA